MNFLKDQTSSTKGNIYICRHRQKKDELYMVVDVMPTNSGVILPVQHGMIGRISLFAKGVLKCYRKYSILFDFFFSIEFIFY